MKPKILVIDDETKRSDSTIDELIDSGYALEIVDNVDEAMQRFEQEHQELSLVILDIMMPPGSGVGADDPLKGLRTGVKVHERLRKVDSGIPIVVFTNVSNLDVAQAFEKQANTTFLRKENFMPFEFAAEVARLLGR
jgi:CheY-like chemotaxis protein